MHGETHELACGERHMPHALARHADETPQSSIHSARVPPALDYISLDAYVGGTASAASAAKEAQMAKSEYDRCSCAAGWT
jgi:hypothetical protein